MRPCPLALDTLYLNRQVRATYERVARAPASGFHFRTGAGYAAQQLRYDADELAIARLVDRLHPAGPARDAFRAAVRSGWGECRPDH